MNLNYPTGHHTPKPAPSHAVYLEFSHTSPLEMYEERGKKTVATAGSLGIDHLSEHHGGVFGGLNPSPAIQDCFPGSCKVTQRQKAFDLMEPYATSKMASHLILSDPSIHTRQRSTLLL